MTLYLRADYDGIPDELSYYDAGTVKGSEFSSKRSAVMSALAFYKKFAHYSAKEHDALLQWLKNNIVETKPGVWGMPTMGCLFGYSTDLKYVNDNTANSAGLHASRIFMYFTYGTPRKYLQIFEGIPINDNATIRKVARNDGDQFIPIKMVHCYTLPEWLIEPPTAIFCKMITDWVDKGDFSAPPWNDNDERRIKALRFPEHWSYDSIEKIVEVVIRKLKVPVKQDFEQKLRESLVEIYPNYWGIATDDKEIKKIVRSMETPI